MRRVDFLHHRTYTRSGVVALSLGMIAMCLSLKLHQDIREERAKPHVQKLPDRIKQPHRQGQVKSLIDRPDASLLSVLAHIEHCTVAPTLLLQMSISRAARSVKILGEAERFDHILHYMHLLERGDVLESVQLQFHETTTDDAGQKYVRFSIEIKWGKRE